MTERSQKQEARDWERLTDVSKCFLRDATEALSCLIEALYDDLADPGKEITPELEEAYDERPYGHWYPERGVVVDGVSYIVISDSDGFGRDRIVRFEGDRVAKV